MWAEEAEAEWVEMSSGGDPDKNADYQKEFAHSPALIRRKEDWRILGSRFIIFLLLPSRERIPRPLILFPLKKLCPETVVEK